MFSSFRSGAMFAVAKGDLNVLNILIKAGIDLNLCSAEGVSPLMTAAAQVHSQEKMEKNISCE
jgi:ankyrin repeat protein